MSRSNGLDDQPLCESRCQRRVWFCRVQRVEENTRPLQSRHTQSNGAAFTAGFPDFPLNRRPGGFSEKASIAVAECEGEGGPVLAGPDVGTPDAAQRDGGSVSCFSIQENRDGDMLWIATRVRPMPDVFACGTYLLVLRINEVLAVETIRKLTSGTRNGDHEI